MPVCNHGTSDAAPQVERNGGVGHHQPSHHVKMDGCHDDENSHNSHYSNKTFSQEKKDAHEGEKDSLKFSQSRTCHSKWTPREKYLVTICGLLFLSCVAFILIAFTRDSVFKAPSCPCHGR